MSDEAQDEVVLDGIALLQRAPRVRALLDRTAGSGLSLDGAWLVGGVVRDALLGRDAGPDIDIAVEGVGIAFAHQLATATGGDVVAEHSFGTATIAVDLGDEHGSVHVDVATCRTERYGEPGALPTVQPGVAIEQDLARRDMSANAIAVQLAPDEHGVHDIVDPTGGIADLQQGLLRVLHDASFVDDPTRIFRIARYAARLGFRIEEHTRQLAIDAVRGGALSTVSAQRVRTELELVLRESAWQSLTYLASWGVIERLDVRIEAAFRPPLLLSAIDVACGDDPVRNDRAWPLRLAALTRPLGDDAAGWMSWLGFPAGIVSAARDHIRVLDAVLERGDQLRAMANSDLYLELGEVSDDTIALVALAIGDADPELLTRLVDFSAAVRDTRLSVRGQDVIAVGVPAGPLVGRILGTLFLRSLDGELVGESEERRVIDELVADAQRSLESNDGEENAR